MPQYDSNVMFGGVSGGPHFGPCDAEKMPVMPASRTAVRLITVFFQSDLKSNINTFDIFTYEYIYVFIYIYNALSIVIK